MKCLIYYLSLFVVLNSSVLAWPTFRLFSKRNPTTFQLLETNIDNLGFRRTLETKLIIHGYSSSSESRSLVRIKDELIKYADYNVIMVDWREGAKGPNYLAAQKNTKELGKRVASFLSANNINPKTVHCIGHSLGAHGCGFTGQNLKLKRISGLDPAGPMFASQPINDRLDDTDADFVDVIHTDAVLGIQQESGHVDFYPNGGAFQTGCIDPSSSFEMIARKKQFKTCSHTRVPEYYAESINSSCQFTAIKCATYDDFKNGRCSCQANGCLRLGFHATKPTLKGKYYLQTNNVSPYCRS